MTKNTDQHELIWIIFIFVDLALNTLQEKKMGNMKPLLKCWLFFQMYLFFIDYIDLSVQKKRCYTHDSHVLFFKLSTELQHITLTAIMTSL